MLRRPAIASFLALACLCAPLLHAQDKAIFPAVEEDRDPNHPMRFPEGMDPRIQSVLRDHFEKGLGGYKVWAAINSLRYGGTLELPDRKIRFTAYQKKPDFFRINLEPSFGEEVVMAYDGNLAWTKDSVFAPEPAPIPPEQAAPFIRDAVFGSHLLYPNVPGKSYELLDFTRVEGRTCYQLRVNLPTGQSVTYFIDIESLVIRGQESPRGEGGVQRVIYRDFRPVHGQDMAFTTVLFNDDRQVHELVIERIDVNTGVMPWMFTPPGLPQDVDMDTDLLAPDLETALPGVDATDVTDMANGGEEGFHLPSGEEAIAPPAAPEAPVQPNKTILE